MALGGLYNSKFFIGYYAGEGPYYSPAWMNSYESSTTVSSRIDLKGLAINSAGTKIAALVNYNSSFI